MIHRLVEGVVSYPSGNDDIEFGFGGPAHSKRCARVQAALSDASNVFAYNGTIRERRGLWKPTKWMPLFDGVLSEEEQQAVKQSLKKKKLPVDALLKVASPAPFGRNGETVFDPEIRKAFEIPSSRLPKDLLEALALDSRRDMQDMEMAMKPVYKNWTYRLYKIHMYGPGGKFEDHVDTLHRNNHVATIVLSLPSKHDGGVLHVRHHGEAMKFDSAKGPIKSMYGKGRNFRYVAFFTDCTHSVQEVISGWRVVVQYDVYEEDAEIAYSDDQGPERLICCMEKNKSAGTSKIHDKEQTELVQAVLQYVANIPPTHGVAFFLRHRYSLPALSEVVLKGADRTIYDAFSKRRDLSVSIHGAIVYVETEGGEQGSVYVKAVSMKDFEAGSDDDDDVNNDKRSTDSDDSNTATEKRIEQKKVVTNTGPGKKSTIHLIMDRNNGAMRVHKCGKRAMSRRMATHPTLLRA